MGPVDIVTADAIAIFGHLKPVFVMKRGAGIMVARAPMFFH
jgi:hypothetical protein